MSQQADMKRNTDKLKQLLRNPNRKKFSYTNIECAGCGEEISIYNYHLWRQTPCSCESRKALFVEE